MPDKEKVIKALECCIGTNDCEFNPKEECPYNGMVLCATALELDVMELLKEQEPKKVIFEFSPVCPKCRKPISDGEGIRFCCFCGQAVKWT